MLQGDTIAAVATAPGEGGVAIIRISGPDAGKVLQGCFCARENPVSLPRRMVYPLPGRIRRSYTATGAKRRPGGCWRRHWKPEPGWRSGASFRAGLFSMGVWI